MLKEFLGVGISGAAGALLRFGSILFVQKYLPHSFYLATFAVNVLGCFLMGILLGCLERNAAFERELVLWIGIGFLGSFTTFSGWAADSLTLFKNKQFFLFATNIVAQIALGLAALRLGRALLTET